MPLQSACDLTTLAVGKSETQQNVQLNPSELTWSPKDSNPRATGCLDAPGFQGGRRAGSEDRACHAFHA